MAWQEITASNNSVTLLALIARANDYGVLYFKSGVHTFSSSSTRTSLTLHNKLKLVFEPGAIFLINSGFQLTIDATIEAGFNQIFDGSGTLHVSGIQNQTVYPVWWGLNNLDKMMASLRNNPPAIIDFLNHTYELSKTLEIFPGINYTGNSAIFKKSTNFSGNLIKLIDISSKNRSTNITNLQFISNIGYALSFENKENNIIVENCYFSGLEPNSGGISISGVKLNVTLTNLSFNSLSTSINLTSSYLTLQVNQFKSISCVKDIQSATVQSNLFISNSHFSGIIQGAFVTSQIIITNIIGKISTLTTLQSKLIIGNSIFDGDPENNITLQSNNAMIRNCQWNGKLILKSSGLMSFADCQFTSNNLNVEISGTSPGILKIQGGFMKGKGIICKSGELYFCDLVYQTLSECTFLNVKNKAPSEQNLKLVVNGVTIKKTSPEDKLTYLDINTVYGAAKSVQITHQNMVIPKNVLSIDISNTIQSLPCYQFLGQRILHGDLLRTETLTGGLINDLFYSNLNRYYRCTSSGSGAAWQEFTYILQN